MQKQISINLDGQLLRLWQMIVEKGPYSNQHDAFRSMVRKEAVALGFSLVADDEEGDVGE